MVNLVFSIVKYNKVKEKKVVVPLKHLINMYWKSYAILLQLYKAIVSSRIDYFFTFSQKPKHTFDR